MQPDKEVKVFREMPEQIKEVTKVEGSVVFTAVNRLQFYSDWCTLKWKNFSSHLVLVTMERPEWKIRENVENEVMSLLIFVQIIRQE